MSQPSSRPATESAESKRITGQIFAYGRFMADLRSFLTTPIGFDAARAAILRRFDNRNQLFLRMARDCIYGNPASPYLPLLKDAGCRYDDMASELEHGDLESLLRKLKDNGVWISFDEYKGRKPIRRGSTLYPATGHGFDNTCLGAGFRAQTGGSSGRPTRVQIDLAYLEARACYEHMVFKELDLYGLPFAIWYPRFPGSVGLSNLLRYAKIGQVPSAWFDMELDESLIPVWHDWALAGIRWMSGLSGKRLPKPIISPGASAESVLRWILGQLSARGRCILQSNVSGITRIAALAAQKNADLGGLQFLAGSEPLTPAKKRQVDSVHARVYMRYFSVDAGSSGFGCIDAPEIDALHLASDSTAIIPLRDQPESDGSSPFLLTTFLGSNPKVLLNVELGDQAIITHRRCRCIFDGLGFHTHLSGLRSIVRSTAEGIALPYGLLVRLREEILPLRCGGSWQDFQWVEYEDDQQLTRIRLRIAPRLGPVDEGALTRFLYAFLAEPSMEQRFYSAVWKRADTIRIVREDPRILHSGKIPAIVYDREAGFALHP
jgi:hypothetical protein